MSRLGKCFRLVVPVLFVVAQSPVGYSSSGSAISPLQVIAKFLKDEMKGQRPSENLLKAMRLALFPGNLIRAALVSAPLNFTKGAPSIDLSDMWARSLELATAKTASLQATQHHELLLAGTLPWQRRATRSSRAHARSHGAAPPPDPAARGFRAGSWSIVFGSVLSLVLFRVHVLLLFGLAMLGAFFGLNGCVPTLQYAICIGLPIRELTLAKPAAEPQPPPRADGGKKKN